MRNFVALLVIAAAQTVGAQQALPPGPGADVFKSRCVICHEADIITSQKLTATGWSRSIDKMVRWGSPITPEERKVLEPYLAMHFAPLRQGPGGQAPKPAASHASTDAGQATYQRACLVCHDADIIEQQKLSRTGWTRSVEKMMRWGASVTDADKEPLVDYLFSRFPPR